MRTKYRGVEQLEARRAHNPEVVGSSPASATIKTTAFAVVFLCFLNFFDDFDEVEIARANRKSHLFLIKNGHIPVVGDNFASKTTCYPSF